MKTYVLVVSADLDIYSGDMTPLIGKRYRNISALGEAVGHMLGTDGWELYSAVDFCEKWNTSTVAEDAPNPDVSYIAIVGVEHDE